MTALFDYPRTAAVGRVVPKSRIYEHAGAGTALRERFVAQVDQIIWRYKLAPETIRLAGTTSVPEIQVFEVALRTATLDEDVLRAVDRAIPFPLVFELTHAGLRRAVGAFKRPSDAGGARWVMSAYSMSDWVPDGAPRDPLPVALDLGVLYERILIAMMPEPALPGEDIRSRIERIEATRAKRREIDRISARLHRERQFNKRVAINAELRAAKLELERLTQGDPGAAAAND